jgi:8-oxo-dGTP diphosphatase
VAAPSSASDRSPLAPPTARRPLRLRQAVRALVVDEAERVLLVRFAFRRWQGWALPGGGLQPGEDDESALRRELLEEVGLRDPVVGPHLWTRTAVFPFEDGLYDGQVERVRLVRTPAFTPIPALGWDLLRAEHVEELRWWTPGALADAGVRCAPGQLAALARLVLAEGPPSQPLELDGSSD